jgi:hypothetical protein
VGKWEVGSLKLEEIGRVDKKRAKQRYKDNESLHAVSKRIEKWGSLLDRSADAGAIGC